MIKVKKGLVVGKEVSFLEMILGDEGGCVCRLTAYHDMAELWGAYYGSGPDLPPGGDVPHFESEPCALSFCDQLKICRYHHACLRFT